MLAHGVQAFFHIMPDIEAAYGAPQNQTTKIVLPTDIYYSILEEGIDVQYLINLIEAEDSNATNETYLSHWDS